MWGPPPALCPQGQQGQVVFLVILLLLLPPFLLCHLRLLPPLPLGIEGPPPSSL